MGDDVYRDIQLVERWADRPYADVGLARFRERTSPPQDFMFLYARAATTALQADPPGLGRAMPSIAYARALRRANDPSARTVWQQILAQLYDDEAIRKQAFVFYELTGDHESSQKLRAEFQAFTTAS